MHPERIYKICTAQEWQETLAHGDFPGAAVDHEDGFVHLSTAAQVRETAARYFAEISDLRLFEVVASCLGNDLKWEPSRGGDLFPHAYTQVTRDLIARDWPLPLDGKGGHI